MPNRSNGTISKEKATDLERIRNNQRRCRARQKEYIASLEDKIRQQEGVGIERATNQKLEELATENKSLKRLLQSLGLRDEFLEAYSNAVRIAPNISWSPLDNEHCAQANECSFTFPVLDVLQPQLPQVTTRDNQTKHTAGPFSNVSASKQGSLDSAQKDVPLSWELFDFPAAPTSVSESMDSLMTRAFSDAVTVENVSDTTTLCSWAFSLVLKNNLKGYSTADLDLKLRVGYRHGATPTEGCRVDNKVLLNVLAEIT
ncbi:hypothetical protein BU25DRAFT_416225 [Macroventuria anomochaeta]|uniref:Uncharacterized protein n=1 Tax=Macroventuria anomochaeta TaxID=301207 RepID=A0ACB6RHZ1_9PLEO|nr:uncharacterized protein BU25DRAFT_416225 [Macroventuria anomochaeta]KAF2621317.1 hypothetical protein BU25DRAFT_416225 [Macroventuria anomochaeta]